MYAADHIRQAKKERRPLYRKMLEEIRSFGGSCHMSIKVSAARMGKDSGRRLVNIIADLQAAGVSLEDASDALRCI